MGLTSFGAVGGMVTLLISDLNLVGSYVQDPVIIAHWHVCIAGSQLSQQRAGRRARHNVDGAVERGGMDRALRTQLGQFWGCTRGNESDLRV